MARKRARAGRRRKRTAVGSGANKGRKKWSSAIAKRCARRAARLLPEPPKYARTPSDATPRRLGTDVGVGIHTYLLASDTGPLQPTVRTYIGFAVKPSRRIRQHNGEITGGAKPTKRSHYQWRFAAIVGGFATKRAALRFEFAWQAGSQAQYNLKSLHKVLHMPRLVGDQTLWVAASEIWAGRVVPLVPPSMPVYLLLPRGSAATDQDQDEDDDEDEDEDEDDENEDEEYEYEDD